MICHKCDKDSIKKCVSILKQGKIVIIPTDTVYGFSGIVDKKLNSDDKIRSIKGRSEDKPFIQLISTPKEILKYSDEKIPEEILKYWPGPLTIIVKDKRLEGKKTDTTAFRCPGDEWLRSVIKECDAPVYSTSVNRSGCPILDIEEDIVNEFSSEVDLIVLDGDRKNSLPSTIVKIQNEEIVVLRKGAIEL